MPAFQPNESRLPVCAILHLRLEGRGQRSVSEVLAALSEGAPTGALT